MRAFLLFIFLSVNGLFAAAQKTDSARLIKPRNVNGIMMSPSKTMMDNLTASPEFYTLVNAIKAANLSDTFNGGPITIFAPTNKAFETLAAGKLDTLLLPVHITDLTNLLKYHVIAGRISAKDIYAQIKAGNGQATLTTLSGSTLVASVNANRNIVLTDEIGGQSVISKFDIQQSNGILDVVTAVLSPKAKP